MSNAGPLCCPCCSQANRVPTDTPLDIHLEAKVDATKRNPTHAKWKYRVVARDSNIFSLSLYVCHIRKSITLILSASLRSYRTISADHTGANYRCVAWRIKNGARYQLIDTRASPHTHIRRARTLWAPAASVRRRPLWLARRRRRDLVGRTWRGDSLSRSCASRWPTLKSSPLPGMDLGDTPDTADECVCVGILNACGPLKRLASGDRKPAAPCNLRSDGRLGKWSEDPASKNKFTDLLSDASRGWCGGGVESHCRRRAAKRRLTNMARVEGPTTRFPSKALRPEHNRIHNRRLAKAKERGTAWWQGTPLGRNGRRGADFV